MNFFRRLTAEVPGELLAAQVAASSRTAETADAAVLAPAMPSADYNTIFTALAVLADNPGVLGPDTPGLPTPAGPTGEN